MRLFALLGLVTFMPLSFAQPTDVQTYKIDPSHTSVVFKVNHMGFSNVYGMIGGADGKIMLSESKPETSTFEISVKPETLTTLEKKRDEHLKGPDFFNVKQYPAIQVKSKSVKKLTADQYEITADLTLMGVTKPIKFVFKRMKTGKDPWGKTRTGGETMLKVKRSEHKMTFMSGPSEVGDDVDLFISLEGILQ
jgi:polyisoprenoid-binding protein YceI